MAHVSLTVVNGAHSVTVFEIMFNCQYLLVIIVTGTVCMSSDPQLTHSSLSDVLLRTLC
jgi:hypothetical protein